MRLAWLPLSCAAAEALNLCVAEEWCRFETGQPHRPVPKGRSRFVEAA